MKKVLVDTILPAGGIVKIKKLEDGRYKISQMVSIENEEPFVLIEAEKLSMDDEFMKHIPKTDREKETKDLISIVILAKTKNFYCPKYAPTYIQDEGCIGYEVGKDPYLKGDYYEWLRIAESYKPECNSRLGTRLQYAAFLGVFIKKLIAQGKSVEWAWNMVCNDSSELGDFCNPKSEEFKMELTGSKEICGFCDIANAAKILTDSDNRFFSVAGKFRHPISEINYCSRIIPHYPRSDWFGWIVLDKLY